MDVDKETEGERRGSEGVRDKGRASRCSALIKPEVVGGSSQRNAKKGDA